MVGDGELVSANKNVAVSLLVGILVAVAFGVFSMIFNFLPLQIGDTVIINGMGDIYGILSAVAAVILIASVLTLFVNLEKRYQNINP